MSTESIIQGILSPKVVSDGSGGYTTKTDIVNVDNITATNNIFAEDVSGNGIIHAPTINGANVNGSLSLSVGTPGNPRTITSNGSDTMIFNSNFDLQDHTITSSVNHPNYSVPFVNFGCRLNLNGNEIFTETGDILFGTDINTQGYTINDITGTINLGAKLSFNSAQYGTITITSGNTNNYAGVSGIKSSSIVIATPTSDLGGTSFWVTTDNGGKIIITLSSPIGSNATFNYFVAKF